jgi:hypothetical protein
MPKPTYTEVRDAIAVEFDLHPLRMDSVTGRIAVLIDAAWAETEEELKRGRKADIILSRWLPWHDAKCEKRRRFTPAEYGRALGGVPVLLTCTCGLDDALAQLRESSPDFVARMEAAGAERTVHQDGEPAMSEDEDWEEFNRIQRAKREGYVEGVRERIGAATHTTYADAAARYPLKRRVPHPDVRVDGVMIRVANQAERVVLWRDDVRAFPVSRATLTAALEILDSPFSWVDDTSVEEDPA